MHRSIIICVGIHVASPASQGFVAHAEQPALTPNRGSWWGASGAMPQKKWSRWVLAGDAPRANGLYDLSIVWGAAALSQEIRGKTNHCRSFTSMGSLGPSTCLVWSLVCVGRGCHVFIFGPRHTCHIVPFAKQKLVGFVLLEVSNPPASCGFKLFQDNFWISLSENRSKQHALIHHFPTTICPPKKKKLM